MKRMHVHVSVSDLEASIRFYRELFAAEPTVCKVGYAKWILDDPRVNFAISRRGAAAGIEHLGMQVENSTELAEVHARLKRHDRPGAPLHRGSLAGAPHCWYKGRPLRTGHGLRGPGT